MAVQAIYQAYFSAYSDGLDLSSVSGTLNLPEEMSFAVAQLALTRLGYLDTPSYSQAYLTGFTANGLFGTLPNNPPTYGVSDADSFSYGGDVSNGNMTGSITVYCFE